MKTTKNYFIEGKLVQAGSEIEIEGGDTPQKGKQFTERVVPKDEMHDAVWKVANGFSEYESLLTHAEATVMNLDVLDELMETFSKDMDREEGMRLATLTQNLKILSETVQQLK